MLGASTIRRALPLTRAVPLGLLLTLCFFFGFRDLEQKNARADFERLAQHRIATLESSIALNLNDITSLSAYLSISQPPERVAFARYTAPLLESNKAIQALEWVPRVPKARREEFEAHARRDGLASFQFRDRIAQGSMARAGERDEYAPVYFVEPLRGNERALGFDLLSDPSRREAIQRATDSGELVSTNRVILVQESANQYGVLIFHPVYSTATLPPTVAERRAANIGMALGVLRLNDVVERAGLPGNVPTGLGLTIQDLEAPAGSQLLYPKTAETNSVLDHADSFQNVQVVSVAGRRWQITAYSLPGTFEITHYTSWTALVVGLLVTGLWAAYLQSNMRRQSVIAQTVAERTQELKTAMAELASANQALQNSEERYKKLLDLFPDAVIIGRKQAITVANKAAVELFGVASADELIGRRLSELIHVEDRESAEELTEYMYRNEAHLPLHEARICRSDGSVMDVDIAASSFRESGTAIVQAVLRDITLRKKAEADHARLIESVEQVGESVVITDREGRIVYVNPAFERITGYTEAEALGKNPRVLNSGQQPKEFYEQMWAALLRGETWVGKFINRRKDGTLFHEEATISPIRDKTGEVINYVAVKRDVTRNVQMQEQLNQAQKMEAIGQLAGGIAHDFNNILMVITGCAEMLQLPTETETSRNRHAEQILAVSKRASDLTRQLLAFSRKQMVSNQVISLNALVEETMQMLRRLIGENIDISFRPIGEPGRVLADSGQIVQVLMNLCVNARDAMPCGGLLSIETAIVNVDDDFIYSHPEFTPGQYVMLSVADTGNGMTQEVLTRIFEPFFSTKGLGRGTGLGLATVYGIIKQSSGQILVSSESGHGTCFQCYFPRVTEPEGTMLSRPSAELQCGGETILLVEDEPQLREIVREFLIDCGYVVLQAENGVEAMKLAGAYNQRIDLLITDVVMPKMGGRDLHEKLITQRPYIKTLYMSGHIDDSALRNELQTANIVLLQKPFSLLALANKLRDVLKQ